MESGEYRDQTVFEIHKVAVLLPCYNEEATIEKVVTDFKTALPHAHLYVYDNNSTDRTAEYAARAGAIVRYEPKQGKGNVIRSMFRDIDADCYLMADGDDTYPSEFAAEMCRLVLEKGSDMVIGDRLSSTYFTENKRPFHNTGNVLVKTLVNKIFQGNISDIMTGYRAFSQLFVKSFPVLSKGFEIETEMTIHALDKNMNITSIPVTYRDRPTGSVSKLNTFRDGFKVVNTILRLFKDYRPLLFFSFIALLLLAISLIFLFPVILEYYKTGLVERFPTLIVTVFGITCGLLSFICGIILDTITKHFRQDYEFKLTILSRNATKLDDDKLM